MRVIDTAISDVKIIEPRVFGDERGFFVETWNQKIFREHGLDINFVQDNYSRSKKGTLRGLHYQMVRPQGKLVRVVVGSVFDVAVDMRRSSPSFGKSVCIELSAENHRTVWIPPGFAHGFLVLSESADFIYKCTDFYLPEHERSLLWNDPQLAILWPIIEDRELILAPKDANGKPLQTADCYE